jgi:hypothetical protein
MERSSRYNRGASSRELNTPPPTPLQLTNNLINTINGMHLKFNAGPLLDGVLYQVQSSLNFHQSIITK